MQTDQITTITILALAMAFFMWNRWRYDIVAGIALLAAVFTGVVPAEIAFDGFSHPAVITVACVLVISQAIQLTGVVDFFLRFLARTRRRFTTQIVANTTITALLSAFMNNVGALALMLPVTVRDARHAKRSPHQLLMPLSFASLLGGLTTLIGTPPNIVIATFRTETEGAPFGMFDFTPVGLAVAIGGLIFIVTIGWRLIPQRAQDEAKDYRRFKIANYITEANVPPGSNLAGSSVGELEQLCDNELNVLSIIRGDQRFLAPRTSAIIIEGDILILEGDSAALKPLLDSPGLVQVGAEDGHDFPFDSTEVRVVEVVVMPHSAIEGRSMRALRMHSRFGVNLLAVARKDSPLMTRLGQVDFRTGDVLLLQGERTRLAQLMQNQGLLPLAKRDLDFGTRKRASVALGVFAASVFAAAVNIVPIQIAFAAAVVALILLDAIPLGQAYRSVEWPIIVLLGCLIPIGEALKDTGTTDLIAGAIAEAAAAIPMFAVVGLLIATSMLLSDLVHNTPTAVLMAPIAASLATAMGVSADPFLMAVAIGAASPYLTPIGHQSNTLVMGPGGYQFGDYWRLGLPLDMVIIAIAVPMIMWVWT